MFLKADEWIVWKQHTSTCECNKVVTDILAKLSFPLIWKMVKHTIQDLA